MSRHEPKWWLWFDFETTGLWTAADEPPQLLEMAAVLLPFGELDFEKGEVLTDTVFKCAEHHLQAMDSFVVDMHVKNGLLDEVRKSTTLPAQAELEVVRGLLEAGARKNEVALAGSGIAAFDVPLLRLYMFQLYDFVHYAPYDLGLGRRILNGLWSGLVGDAPGGDDSDHRALGDVKLQLAEAAWYRDNYIPLNKSFADLP